MVATKQQDGETIHQLEEKLHRLRVNDKVLKSFKRDHTGRGMNKPVKAVKRDDMGNAIIKTPKITSAEQLQLHEDVQQVCNPHDTLNNRKATLFPVMGDIETTAYLDVDSVVVSYPNGTDAAANLLASQTCGILYNDYVRNTITYTALSGAVGPQGNNPTYRYDAQFTPVLDTSGNYIVSQTPASSVRLVMSQGISTELPIAYLKGNTSKPLTPHGAFLPVGQSDRFGGNWVYVDQKASINATCINNHATIAYDAYMTVWKYTPGGASRVGGMTLGSIPAGGQGSASYINNSGDGYYKIMFHSVNATYTSQFTFLLNVANYNTTQPGDLGDLSGQTHIWSHLPAPGFQAVAPLMEMVRLNGTVLEYHNVGSVTNGEIYCAQFAGQDWTDIANTGFGAIMTQTKDNSFNQGGDQPQGALVRLNFGGGRDPLQMQQQHKHQNGVLTSVFFPLDNPGAFCMIFSNINLGNLGSPQNAVWKRGCHMQFQTTDTTRSPGVSTMSRQHFRAVVTIASQVPFFGPNEFHWSDVKDWISGIIDKAVKVAPIAQGLLAVL